MRKPQAVTPPAVCYTGVNIILGVLFYLMQARKFLQEGVTYTLGSSFYLAWINVFFFFMIGLAGLWCDRSCADRVVGIVGSQGRVSHSAREDGTGLGARAGDSCRLGVVWGQAEGEVDLGFKDGAGARLGQCRVYGEASLLTSVLCPLSLSGLFSYLNYINFWSILSLQASWS